MEFGIKQILYLLLTLFIVLNYGLILQGIMPKIAARVGRRYGIRWYQPYLDLIKNHAKRSKITHGVMYYLGPVFRLTGGIGLLFFLPVIYGSPMFDNLSFAGDLTLVLFFQFFGVLGMALGAGEGGHPYSAIGVSRGLSQVTALELPLTLGVISIAMQYHTLNISDIVAAQQGGILNWTIFTNPFAGAALMLTFLGSMGRAPFDVVLAPQEIPIGPPTEYHSGFLGVLQLNRAIFPVAKLILFMNLLYGGATSWPELFIKTFFIYLWSIFVGVAFPRFRVDQSVRWFLGVPLLFGIIAILLI
ncbi:MAG: complex I subunit 1 family protein [Tenuifilum sp.]|uniref:respiratory chain complex I subunit 1 family protein n=1 Tax=Tenuifilum sp. TaxID=2760880 RepID=UPI001B6C4C53|nr:NADH-quinone oxidoreductase subunit H [Bacteroidales bacterium]HOK60592.1 NADH-quinone oxidoreductase subunit H [Tenuifilum sp.]MBP9029425.1 NADH-quinone oxidoreductase subunit H [Bacteroidales bacterium]HOK84819.1 NADH-quinone oxidoreductase subunit H [Tenuifilum sp.]HON69478.1 NADH-quinone oxidoreductase subunit H [Tenuifilum sp.]